MSTEVTEPHSWHGLAHAVRTWTNASTVRGGLAVVGGLLVLLLPTVTPAVVPITATAFLVLSAVVDLGYAILGHGPVRAGRRWVAGLRGAIALAAAITTIWTVQDSVVLLIFVVGLYLTLRGIVQLIGAAFARDPRRRQNLLLAGVTSLGLGLVALVSPQGLETSLVAFAAITAIVIGSLVLTHGVRAAVAGDRAAAGQEVTEILRSWIAETDVGPDRREEVVEPLYFEPPGRAAKQLAWWVMLVLSVAIATYAVLQDSTAVVIGAMLVAPLMSPILGLAAALVNGWRRRALTSLLQVVAGALASVVLATALSSWLPIVGSYATNSQIASRVGPTLLDMLVAIAAGAAGAFATVNRRVSSSIAGVAIAVALVPPLAVVGISLGAGRFADAAGATLLFLTNFIAIVLASAVVFLLGGLVTPATLRGEGVRQMLRTLAPFGAAALLVLVPLTYTSEGLLREADAERAAHTAVADWLADTPDLTLVSVTVDGAQVDVAVAGARAVPNPEALQDELSDAIGRPATVRISRTPTYVTEVGPG